MEQIKILTKIYILTEYFCCAISDKKCAVGYNAKKSWLKNHFVPDTIYSVFQDGKFVTQHIINEKKFHKFIH